MTATEGRLLVEADWLTTASSTVLHHATLTEERYVAIAEESQLADEMATFTCGIVGVWPVIPGLLSRLGRKRCNRCCDRLGYPRGVGSPKNADLPWRGRVHEPRGDI